MVRTTAGLAGALAAAALLTGGVAAAQTPAAPSATPAVPAMDAFEQMMAAQTVADFARRNKYPQGFIVAARMLKEIPTTDAVGATNAGAAAQVGAFSPEGLLAEASAMAGDNPELQRQISRANAAPKGVLSSAFGRGLVRIIHDVGARGSYAFPIKAKGGERLRVGAIGGATSRMLMRLRDATGRVVCQDDSRNYASVCEVDPRAAGDYRVEVVNRSDATSRTVILSN